MRLTAWTWLCMASGVQADKLPSLVRPHRPLHEPRVGRHSILTLELRESIIKAPPLISLEGTSLRGTLVSHERRKICVKEFWVQKCGKSERNAANFGRECFGGPEALEKQGQKIAGKFAERFAVNFRNVRQTKLKVQSKSALHNLGIKINWFLAKLCLIPWTKSVPVWPFLLCDRRNANRCNFLKPPFRFLASWNTSRWAVAEHGVLHPSCSMFGINSHTFWRLCKEHFQFESRVSAGGLFSLKWSLESPGSLTKLKTRSQFPHRLQEVRLEIGSSQHWATMSVGG